MASNFGSWNKRQQSVRTAAVRQNVAMTAPAILGLGHLDFTVTDGDPLFILAIVAARRSGSSIRGTILFGFMNAALGWLIVTVELALD